MLVVSRHKHRDGHIDRPDLFDYLEAIFARHLNVKKKQIRLGCFQRLHDFATVSTHGHNINVRIRREKYLEALAGQRLIIGDHRSQGHEVAFSYGIVIETSNPPDSGWNTRN